MLRFLHLYYHKHCIISDLIQFKFQVFWLVCLLQLAGPTWGIAQDGASTETLIEKNALWHYFDKGQLTSDWISKSPTKHWEKGQAPFGYNIDSLSTLLDYGNDAQKKRIVYYFKKSFFIDQPSSYMAYMLNIRRDDGVIVYLNNKEVGRQNMPIRQEAKNLKISQQSLLPVTGNAESNYYPLLLNPSVFKKGVNIIAVSLHQRSPSSSDAVFDLELLGLRELSSFQDEISALSSDEAVSEKFQLFSTQLALEKTNTNYQLLLQKLSFVKLTYIWITGILLVLFILSCVLAAYLYRKNNAYVKTLKDYDEFIKKSNQEKLKNSIQEIENASFLETIQTKLHQLKKSRLIDANAIESIASLIKNRQRNKVNMEELAIHIDSLNANFSRKLLSAFPTLTQNEIRHCCLIRIQLSTKEISRILHVDPRSIQTARYRIKKKLKLKETEDLLFFLMHY